MTRENSCCHECAGSRTMPGRHCRSRRSRSANGLAEPAVAAREGRPYPVEIRENTGFFDRPINWPVWSPVATTRKRLHSIASCCCWPRAAVRQPAPATVPSRSAAASSSPRCAASRPTTTATSTPAPRPISWPLLTQARLVRVNRATDALEPALAERWESAADGRTHTLHLRKGVTFSDGAPVHLRRRAVLVRRRLRRGRAAGWATASPPPASGSRSPRPIRPPWSFSLPVPFAPGLRLLDNLPILPRHKLEAALPQRHDPEGLGAVDAAVGDGRARPVRAEPSTSPASGSSSRAILTTGGRTAEGRRCRTWTG